MDKILPGIKQLKIPIPHNPLGFTNVYLLGDGNEYVLIDAGFNSKEAFEAMQRELAEARVNPKQITQIVITHSHGDHIGLAGQVKELSGATIALHRLEARNGPQPSHDPKDFARVNAEWTRASGLPEEEPSAPLHHGPGMRQSEPARPDVLIEDDQHILAHNIDLLVIWTPGHSPGLVCLYDARRKVLFSADHVLPVTTPNIGLRPGSNGHGDSDPLGDYLRSLKKVRDLDVEVVLPAHEQIFHDLAGRVDRITEHHLRRNQEILKTLTSGPKTAYQVAESITWMPQSGGTRFHALAHWDQRMAVSETISHLQSLRNEGAVERFGEQGIVYYSVEKKT